MPSFELSKLQGISAPRALSESDRAQVEPRASRDAARADTRPTNGPSRPGVALEIGATIDVASAPVDTDRVDQIRKALQDGTYPLVPARIADAIIAARVSFGVEPK